MESKIFTDHQPLVVMYNKQLSTTPPRILRHILGIQELDYKVIFRKGCINIADFLSRNSEQQSVDSEEQNVDLTLSDHLERIVIKKEQAKYNRITMNTILDATINCPDLQFLLKCIRQRNWKRYIRDRQIAPFKTFMPTISCIDDIIYKGDNVSS